MGKKMAAVHIGTSGWSYKHWRERFYPKGMRPEDYLAWYARSFNTTEINTSFYHLPRASTIRHWADSVRQSFRFCPKISRYITHIKKLNDPGQTLPRFFKLFDPIRARLGPVLVQLPPQLPFHPERADTFYRALKTYKGYRFALEPRHDSWLAAESLALLRRYRIAFVITESGGRWPTADLLTARHVYVRFHGPGGYDRPYADSFLHAFADKIAHWREAGLTVWVFFNNDGRAHAVRNALTLLSYTGG